MKVDWEMEILYRGRPLSDYRKAIVEECARNVRRESIEECARVIEDKWPWTQDHLKDRHYLATAIRALKDKIDWRAEY